MAKYDRLKEFLLNQSSAEVALTFARIEKILKMSLPNSATEHREWWANPAGETHGHVHAKAWRDAGYEASQVDLTAKKLVFKRITQGKRYESKPQPGDAAQTPRRSPLFGALKGTFSIESGYDLTQPAMPEWADSLDSEFGPDLPR
jgi:hypothetical protein